MESTYQGGLGMSERVGPWGDFLVEVGVFLGKRVSEGKKVLHLSPADERGPQVVWQKSTFLEVGKPYFSVVPEATHIPRYSKALSRLADELEIWSGATEKQGMSENSTGPI